MKALIKNGGIRSNNFFCFPALFLVCVWFFLAFPPFVFSQPVKAPLIHPPGNFVQIDGKKIWFESEGKGEAVILIAGGPGLSHAYFHPFFSGLADFNRIIYFDAFGTGKSDRAKTEKGYSLAAAVEDLEALRKSLKLEKINILGHSYGGFVAQIYATKYPDSVARLILANTLPSGENMQASLNSLNRDISNQFPEVWEKLVSLRAKGFVSGSKEHQAAFDVPGTLHNFYNPENARKMPVTEPNLYNPDLWYAIAGDDADFFVTGELARFDVRDKLKQLNMPVLIIAGRFDRNVRPVTTLQYKQLAPQAEFVMFEKSGHFPFIEETENTNAVLRSFLKKKA